MMHSKHFGSSVSFKLKIENNDLLSFNGQSHTSQLSIKVIQFESDKRQRY